MSWLKLVAAQWLEHDFGSPLPADHWGQADVWLPASTLTACGELGFDNDLLGESAGLLSLGVDQLAVFDHTYPTGDWRWLSQEHESGAGLVTTGTTHTLKYHYTQTGSSPASVAWYLDGVLLFTDTARPHPASSIALGIGGDGCACEVYYITNVKIGTTDGASDLFADDFSGGLGAWTVKVNEAAGIASAEIVSAPADGCPTITVSPVRGQGGSVAVTLTGSGFAPSSSTKLWVSRGTPVPVGDWSASTDGGGAITGSFLMPRGVFTTGTDPDGATVFLEDELNGVGWAHVFLCGEERADAINIDAGGPLTGAGSPSGAPHANANRILDYIWHNGCHWVLWQDPSQVGNGATFPPPANHALNATCISADGSTITDYPIDTEYAWEFGESSPIAVNESCFVSCGAGSVRAPLEQFRFYFTGWSKPILDCRFASDGTNLWVAVLTRETIPYPWLDNGDARCDNIGSLNQFVDLATLTLGFTVFATSSGSGYPRWQSNTVGPVGYEAGGFPVSDPGDRASGHWSPPVVVMFSFDGAAFNRIGQVAAAYAPGFTDGYANGNGAGNLGTEPVLLQSAPRGSLITRVSLAANPIQPGVCHLVWGEGGDWGRCGLGDCHGPLVWDGGPPFRDYRLNYTTWDPSGKTSDNDLAHSSINRTSWEFPFTIGSFRGPCGYTWPDPAHFGTTGLHDVRNDSGSPLLFLSVQQSIQNCYDPNADTFGAPPHTPNDGVGNPWLDYSLVFGDTVYVYDISGGTLNLLQTLGPGLLPDEDEVEYFYDPATHTSAGVPPFASDCLYAAPVSSPSVNFNQGVIDRGFSLSDAYADPLLGNAPVYLLTVPWAQRFPTASSVPGFFNMRGLYRIPIDASATFDFLDGDRQINFTMLPDDGDVAPASGVHIPFGDFFSDPRVIWAPNRVTESGLSTYKAIQYTGFLAAMFDRICDNVWEALVEEPSTTAPSFAPPPACPGFYYDPDSDTISYAAAGDGVTSLFEVVVLFICRRCRNCKCGSGIHLAHRF